MKDREFHSYDEIEEAIVVAWKDLTFEDIQSVFYDYMRRFAWVIENEGESILEQKRNGFFDWVDVEIGPGAWDFLYTLYVRTARQCSDVKEWNEMKSENRVIDDEND
jgi:hypothetical protein